MARRNKLRQTYLSWSVFNNSINNFKQGFILLFVYHMLGVSKLWPAGHIRLTMICYLIYPAQRSQLIVDKLLIHTSTIMMIKHKYWTKIELNRFRGTLFKWYFNNSYHSNLNNTCWNKEMSTNNWLQEFAVDLEVICHKQQEHVEFLIMVYVPTIHAGK